ncbi:hypothetical protein FRB99_002641 [Tulasnella sp. 403]|nr:hypothetical protein FRB99_002641 [Tulasnella sp. 403]
MAKTQAAPTWPHYAAVGAIAFALFAGAFRHFIVEAQDPQKCSALMNEGEWLDNNSKNWQPEGCMAYNYGPKDVTTCMADKRVIFAGDAVTRQLFYAVAHLADPSLPSGPSAGVDKANDVVLRSTTGKTSFEFLWDPFLNTSAVTNMLRTGDTKGDRPALFVIGSGLWYLHSASESGGLSAWEAVMTTTLDSVQKTMPGLADNFVVLPVEQPIASKLSTELRSLINTADVDTMNNVLQNRLLATSPAASPLGHTPPPTYPIAIPSVFNKMLSESETNDGILFSDKLLAKQANILLNFKCNSALSKHFPMNKTCCNSYPRTSWIQFFVIFVVIFYGPFCRFVAPSIVASYPAATPFFPSSEYIMPLTIFGGVVGLSFLADRTSVFMKEQKQFDPWWFSGLCLASLAVGLATIKKKDKDLGFLNREQTDEWKGWMQIAILIYHYLGASKVAGIYNPIRVLVAAYLWMTGYGHFHFYYKKADYGLLRIAQVLVRLNLLTVALAYVMDTDYVFYYFAPLVSFWWTIVYLTMGIGYKYNENTPFLLIKLLSSCAAVTYVFKSEWLIDGLFAFLGGFFAIPWQAKEWMFRVTLDMWIVYVGMFSAFATIKVQQHNVTHHPKWQPIYKTSLVVSILTLVWFFWFELSQPSKFAYNAWHPYVSWAPVLAFVVLRNATPALRSASSTMFGFIGRCSLETFIMQYHFWMAADTKGLLVVLPAGFTWRTINMALATAVFVYVSHQVSEATGSLTNWICGAPKKRVLPPPATAPTGAANGRPEEAIPLMAQNGEAKAAEGTKEAAAATESLAAAAPTNRLLESWVVATKNPSVTLGAKGAGIVFSLWMLNLLWP